MAEEAKAMCPVCEHEVGTKEDGSKFKAHKVNGEKCAGSDELVSLAHDDEDWGVDKGQSYEPLEGAQDDDETDNDQNDGDTPDEPETGTQGVATSSAPEFVHTVKVINPCGYLGESWWHQENIKAAAVTAQRAGHVLAGAEPQHKGTEDHGTFSLVHYSVPVK